MDLITLRILRGPQTRQVGLKVFILLVEAINDYFALCCLFSSVLGLKLDHFPVNEPLSLEG